MTHIIAYSGIVRLSRKQLEALGANGKKVNIEMAGLLLVAGDVSPALVEETVGRLRLQGVIVAPGAVKEALQRKRAG